MDMDKLKLLKPYLNNCYAPYSKFNVATILVFPDRDFFGVNVDEKICLDIGCATGGFTEVLLKKKAKKIYVT